MAAQPLHRPVGFAVADACCIVLLVAVWWSVTSPTNDVKRRWIMVMRRGEEEGQSKYRLRTEVRMVYSPSSPSSDSEGVGPVNEKVPAATQGTHTRTSGERWPPHSSVWAFVRLRKSSPLCASSPSSPSSHILSSGALVVELPLVPTLPGLRNSSSSLKLTTPLRTVWPRARILVTNRHTHTSERYTGERTDLFQLAYLLLFLVQNLHKLNTHTPVIVQSSAAQR